VCDALVAWKEIMMRGVLMVLLTQRAGAIASTPHFFKDQLVDHFAAGDAKYTQRYFEDDTAFKGPGHPILLIVGGEGAIPPSVGLFYPYVVDVLAPMMGALVVEPEHRFYGNSTPDRTSLHLLTPQQALADAVRLVRAMQVARNCSLSRQSSAYCPVFSVGGSYPGFLSAMLRLRYPAVVDGAYAASAPMRIYAQQVQQYAYYEVITKSAERAQAGCAASVAAALKIIGSASTATLVKELNLCAPLPAYIVSGGDAALRDALLMVYEYSFAGLNMGNYPPGPSTGLARACRLFATHTPGQADVMEETTRSTGERAVWAALRAFLAGGYATSLRGSGTQSLLPPLSSGQKASPCYDLTGQLPAGPNATVTCADWSGCGTGADGRSWDFETCRYLVEPIGTNGGTDMFPPREWSLSWLTAHCKARFGTVPAPTALVEEWGFDATGLLAQGASRILFTNGLNDGWSAGGFLTNLSLSQDLITLNMPNGAHHSDLRHTRPCPAPDDTADVLAARKAGAEILMRWLREVKAESYEADSMLTTALAAPANACPPTPPIPPPFPNATTVAAVGDSITAGYLSSCRGDYPSQLQRMLGPNYRVTNFGVGGTTLLRHADHPYWNTTAFNKSRASNADIVVIMLGTNDAKRWQWPKLHSQYMGDYKVGAADPLISCHPSAVPVPVPVPVPVLHIHSNVLLSRKALDACLLSRCRLSSTCTRRCPPNQRSTS
jgi:pimeloyl-ACP methyl ester carboxylesterase